MQYGKGKTRQRSPTRPSPAAEKRKKVAEAKKKREEEKEGQKKLKPPLKSGLGPKTLAKKKEPGIPTRFSP